MTFETVIRSAWLREAVRSSPLGPFMDGFVDSVASVGYTAQSMYGLVLGATQLARHLTSIGLTDVTALRDQHVESFIATLPRYRCRQVYWMRQVTGTRAAHHMIEYLRRIGATPSEPRLIHPYSWVLDEWTAFLGQHRGLAPASIDVYRGGVEPFLRALGVDATADRLVALTAARVHAHVERRAAPLARATRKSLVITLRSFLRFAFSRGYLPHDLGNVVPRVPCFSQDRLPCGPKWADVATLLTTIDRSTPHGARDFALLLILITYGVRRSQVVDLTLDDLDWRASTLRMPASKRGRRVVVPITAAVGNALVAYLRTRPTSGSRSIFLSMAPPFRPLAAGSVYNVVSEAFRRAKIPTPHRGSHAIRHAWATRALAQGQRLKTIADLLGHRSLESTRIYAKVDVTQLRTVALPWPVAEVR